MLLNERNTPKSNFRSMLKVVIPTIVMVSLFLFSIFFLHLPSIKKSLLLQKQKAIRDHVQLVMKNLQTEHDLSRNGIITTQEAQRRAMDDIVSLRYGDKQKDYFWILAENGTMLVHPYRPEMVGNDVRELTDPTGKKFINEFLKAVETDGGGIVEYLWYWNDRPDELIPKVSYVKKFQPWGWVVGTGLYIDDITQDAHDQIAQIAGITGIIIIAVFFLAAVSIRETRQTAAQMLKNEELLRAIFNQSQQFMGILSFNGVLLEANQTSLNFIAARREDCVGLPFWETPWWNHSVTAQTVLKDSILQASQGQTVNFITSHINFIGEIKQADVSIKPVLDHDGQIIYLMAEARDITERITIENALRDNERYNRLLFDISPVGMAVCDDRGFITDANKTLIGLLKKDLKALSKLSFANMTPVDYYNIDNLMREKVRQFGSCESYEKELINDDGIRIPVRVAWSRFLGDEKLLNLVTIEDISDLKKAENEVRASEQKYRDLVENLQSIILRWRADGTILFVNEFGLDYFGYREEELIGKNIAETILPQDDNSADVAKIVDGLRDDYSQFRARENENVLRNGSHVWISWTNKVFEGYNGEIEEILSVGIDSTEKKNAKDSLEKLNLELEQHVEERTKALANSLEDLKNAQQQLVESEKMASLGGLVAGVAHEINTPIGVGVTTASYLEEKSIEIVKKYQDNAIRRSDFENYMNLVKDSSSAILINLRRASELIQSFKKVAVDQTTETRREFEVISYLNEILMSLHSKYKRTGHKIEVSGDPLTVNSYPGAFMQIITNLIMNSLIHAFETKENGLITIKVEALPKSARIIYTDDGSGMTPEQVRKIFEPFFTTKRAHGGTGLGMHIVYNLIARKLGGTIVCDSEPGMGTRFVIEMPIEGPVLEQEGVPKKQ